MKGSLGDPVLWCFAVLLSLTAVFVVVRFELVTDITEFLPVSHDDRLGLLFKALARGTTARSMILSVEGPDAQAAIRGARELATRIQPRSDVEWVESGPDKRIAAAFYRLYYPRRFGRISTRPEEDIPELLSDDGLRRAARALRARLASPDGYGIKNIAAGDPFLIFPVVARRALLQAAHSLTVEDGAFLSADRRHALIFLTTRPSAFDASAQQHFLADLQDSFQQVNRGFDGRLGMEAAGVNRFAMRSRRGVRTDILRISLVSAAAIIALFLAAFGSASLFAAAMLPIICAFLVATGAGLVLFGRLHALTFAFGATLLGVCVDYPIHYLCHRAAGENKSREALDGLWRSLRLGGLTTAAGFSCLLLSSYPGIREIATFGAIGVLAALACTRMVLPRCVTGPICSTILLRRGLRLSESGLERIAGRPALLIIPLAAFVVGVYGLGAARWSDDVRALDSRDPRLLAEDARVRERVGGLDPGRFVVAMGQDEEEALRLNDAVEGRLAEARSAGMVGSYRSVSAFLWSKKLEERNYAALARSANLVQRVKAAFAAEGFRPEAFAEFDHDLRAPHPPSLRWKDLKQTPLWRLVEAFHVDVGRQVGFLTFLGGVTNAAAVARKFDGLPGAFYFDQSAFLNGLYRRYRSQVALLMMVSFALVVLIVALHYRDRRRAAIACAPPAFACLATPGILSLMVGPLNLLNLLALVLVFGLGIDYGILLAEGFHERSERPVRVLSVCLACAFTVLAFGLLSMSRNPALRSIGLATGVGVMVSLAMAISICAFLTPDRDAA